ncbi:MAG TPA: group III truncated hemoglobin [Rhodothermales bacterium]|nr:group III truncated hemoglobin [Rhodothermales bacterium]
MQTPTNSPLPDISDDTDIRAVVDAFYGDIVQDPVIGHYFADVDMAAHLPRMVAFWSSVVFQTGTYHGRPFDVHLKLAGLSPAHFAAWLGRFDATVDTLFEGEAAGRMKEKAHQIGAIFQMKLCPDSLPLL